ncbi:hypothetical protein VOLCADRAFT_92879 [Volvox carteri f. nagariensis]|uniref:Uncharacterized protein n=1 Tax=Volvox carteri f. nagariensis TaxID=3068 RepID=D8U0Q0_VOLCA|nr:uncharacterized protein VOLCADRAFT_92879 [Volvox carteri f. nagariensis]EFJ46676.1 hypothetical protein VOLCADRAFT_92879 [Volvox carteri f. nagariensis]|eukprot:XP_002952205.1 hypothetical protein VOLCADRAFT_92879 [Volvox carteri f. nagariensis]
MSLSVSYLATQNPVGRVVVRPRGTTVGSSNGNPQTLVFFKDHIRELIEISGSSTANGTANGPVSARTFRLSCERLQVEGRLCNPRLPTYEPITDSIFFVENGTAIKRLDRNNRISLVAGSDTQSGNKDGCGWMARFQQITALMADGKGNVHVSDYSNGQCHLRVVLVRTGDVYTPKARGRALGFGTTWRALSYDVEADMMVGASPSAIYHMAPYGIEFHNPTPPAMFRLVAGDKQNFADYRPGMDGKGVMAHFKSVYAILAGANGRVLVVDSAVGDMVKLRVVDADGTVSSLGTLDGAGYTELSAGVLPQGELVLSLDTKKGFAVIAIISGVNFVPSSEILAGWQRHPVVALLSG